MRIIDNQLMDSVVEQAKESPRLRMNYNFHAGMEDMCHRMLNALEPGTVIPIHRHATKDKSIVLLRGKIRVNIHNDQGEVKESVVLCHEEGNLGVDIQKQEWHSVESLESGSIIFEVKAGPYMPEDVTVFKG
jgi:cupin fold WbuC family metalloprotein